MNSRFLLPFKIIELSVFSMSIKGTYSYQIFFLETAFLDNWALFPPFQPSPNMEMPPLTLKSFMHAAFQSPYSNYGDFIYL